MPPPRTKLCKIFIICVACLTTLPGEFVKCDQSSVSPHSVRAQPLWPLTCFWFNSVVVLASVCTVCPIHAHTHTRPHSRLTTTNAISSPHVEAFRMETNYDMQHHETTNVLLQIISCRATS